MISCRVIVLPLAFAAALSAGCDKPGPPDVPVKGKLVGTGGTPFRNPRPANKPLPPGDTGVRVRFTSLEGDSGPGQPKPAYVASVDPDTGVFEVLGLAGKGIPAGKYRVTAHVGAAGEEMETTGRPSNVPPTVENAADDDTGLDGKEVARIEVMVPPEGVTELTVEVRVNKK